MWAGYKGPTGVGRSFLLFGLGFLCSMMLFDHIRGGWLLAPFGLYILAGIIDDIDKQRKRHPDRGLITAIVDYFFGEKTRI